MSVGYKLYIFFAICNRLRHNNLAKYPRGEKQILTTAIMSAWASDDEDDYDVGRSVKLMHMIVSRIEPNKSLVL